ncbi:MAG: polysaccharide biosynthesis C-terminal domain-containing protein [bacterium]
MITSPRLFTRLASAVSLTGLGSVITLGLSGLVGVAVARNGGPSGYAVFVAANMIVFVTSVFCSVGMPLALGKYVAAHEETGRRETLIKTNTTALLLLLSVVLVTSLALSYNLPRLEQHLNLVIGPGFALAFPLIMVCAVISDAAQGIYFGLLRLGPVIAISVSGPAAVVVYIIVRRLETTLPIWGAVAVLYITCGLVAVSLLFRDRLLGRPGPIKELKKIIGDLIPVAAFTFFTVFSAWSDRWIVGTQLGAVAMGSYAAAVVVIQTALRIPTHVAYLLVPASSRAAWASRGNSTKLNSTTLNMFASFAALMTLIILLASGSIVTVIFGPGFALAGPVLLIMAPGLIASAISIPIMSVLTGSKKNRWVTYLLGLTLVPRILMLMFFTRRWDLQGTAVAMVFSESLLALCCILVARKIGIPFELRKLMRPYLLALLAYGLGLLMVLLGLPKLVAAGAAAAVFVVSLWRFARPPYMEIFQNDPVVAGEQVVEQS